MAPKDRFEEIVRGFEACFTVRSSGRVHALVHQLLANAEDARRVCEFFGINETMTPQEESERLVDWFNYGILKRLNYGILKSRRVSNSIETAQRTLRTVWMMIGHWYSVSQSAQSPKISQLSKVAIAPPTQEAAIGEVALALLIPPSKYGELLPTPQGLALPRVLELISNAIYFRCSLPKVADTWEEGVELGDVSGTSRPTVPGDLYVRVDIERGGDLLKAGSPFAIKNCLRDQPHRTFRLTRLAVHHSPPETLHHFHAI